MDVYELSLVADVVIPPKFKILEFEKFNGSTCSMNCLASYYRKMAFDTHDDKFLILFLQDSLTDIASKWYMKLDHNKVKC